VTPLESSDWLKTSAVDKLDSKNILRHRFFLKEFSLNNPSEIKRAQLLIYPESNCHLRLNSRWINQKIIPGKLNVVDVTGYVQKGDNKFMLDFPFEDGDKAFAAELDVEYFNTNRVKFTTGQSWLMKDSYTFPPYLTGYSGFNAPESVESKQVAEGAGQLKKKQYEFSLPEGYADGLNNVYLRINCTGDKARLFYNYRLMADDFYNGDTWEIGLNCFNFSL